MAELFIDALAWACEACPEAGFLALESSDWRERSFGWKAGKDGLLVRLDPKDGLAVWEDPFARRLRRARKAGLARREGAGWVPAGAAAESRLKEEGGRNPAPAEAATGEPEGKEGEGNA